MPTSIACDLTALDPTARAREGELLRQFRQIAAEANPIENGYEISIPSDAATLSNLGEFLALERRCCPFLRFGLDIDSSEHARLRIVGPDGAAEFIAATFLR